MTSISPAATLTVGVRARARAVAGVTVFGTTFLLGLGFAVRTLDPWESWFLQVVVRMRAGDVLYRDVAYGAGPLPAYVTEGLTYVVGTDVLAVKLAVALAFAATAVLAWLIAEEIGIGFRGRLLVVGAVSYLAAPQPQPPYAPLAGMFLLGLLLSVLRSRRAATARATALAGVVGGLCAALAFASKQNVGLLAIAALLLVCFAERRVRPALYGIASFAVGCFLLLLPVLVSGGFARYVDYGFTGKGTYIHAPGVFRVSVHAVADTWRHVHGLGTADDAFWTLPFFFPALALLAFLAVVYAAFRNRTLDSVPFVVVALVEGATLYPRFEPTHVAFAAPGLVLLVAYALHRWRKQIPRVAWAAIVTWLGAAVALMAAEPIRLAHSPAVNLSRLPHLRGAFVNDTSVSQWTADAKALRSAAGDDRKLFLLLPDAGLRYVMTGLDNPTPFDFPLASTFGRNGQQRVVSALRAGDIRRVCLGSGWPAGLEPTQIVGYVQRKMHRGRQAGPCRMYTS